MFSFHSAHPTGSAESISGIEVCDCVCLSVITSKMIIISAQRLHRPLYNHTYSESLWWKLFKNHQRTQIQRQRQWQRQRQRQRHRKSAWNTHLMLYFLNPDDSLIPNMMIDTSPWPSCSRQSPWLVTLFRSYNQFYRAECITISGFFIPRVNFHKMHSTQNIFLYLYSFCREQTNPGACCVKDLGI